MPLKNKKTKEEFYISQPLPASKLYHVFNQKTNDSLCGKAMILFPREEWKEPVTGKETYKKGQDCKSCFNKLSKLLTNG